jgi:bifunctional non-homologous end joining protein LigD
MKFAGHVGTGFNDAMLKDLHEAMQALITDKKPIKQRPKLNDKATWLKPELVAEIKFTEISSAGIFRHPVFLRLRDDKIDTTATKEEDKKKSNAKIERNKESIKAGKYTVRISNSDKLFWPQKKITKGDVVAYYESVSTYIVPHLKNRPLSLKRNPNGIKDKGFYHKDAGENVPEYVKVYKHKNEKKVIDYVMCNNKAALLYLANLGCIEINPWSNRFSKEDKPDWLALDLDPGEHNTFKQVVEVAQKIKELTDAASLTSYCKTSGASGLHIYIPLAAKYDYDTVKNFGHLCMQLIEAQLPKIATTERMIKKRGKKIYLDFLQNRPGQTLASVYSLRPVEAATVSMPIIWDELIPSLQPTQFTIYNALERIEKTGDIFKPVLSESNDLKKAIGFLEAWMGND